MIMIEILICTALFAQNVYLNIVYSQCCLVTLLFKLRSIYALSSIVSTLYL